MKKESKNGGKQTNSIFFLENRQSEYFCLTYFSKPNRDQIQKKLWHFEDNPVTRGGGGTLQKIPKKRHDLSLGFDVLFMAYTFLFVFFVMDVSLFLSKIVRKIIFQKNIVFSFLGVRAEKNTINAL